MNISDISIKTEDTHNTWAWIPNGSQSPAEPGSASFKTCNGTPAVREEIDDDNDDDYSCVKCAGLRFADEQTFLGHHLAHVCQPQVTLSRLEPWFIRKLTSGGKSRPHRPVGIAKKRTKSYIAPKSHGRLKLTLKLSADATDSSSKNRTFHVVSKNSVLAGPAGEIVSANGLTIDGVKVETIDGVKVEREEPTGGVVDGSGERVVEEGAGEPTEGLNGEGDHPEGSPLTEGDDDEEEDYDDGDDSGGPVDGGIDIKEDIVGSPGETGATKLLEEVCRETTDSLLHNNDDDGGEFSDSGSDSGDAAPSPTPSEQLRPDFLQTGPPSPTPSEQVTTDLIPRAATAAMVELSGGSAASEQSSSISPAFPVNSPDVPLDTNHDSHGGSSANPSADDDSSIFQASGLQWGSCEVNEPLASSPGEEMDPLQLPDAADNASMQLLASDALLRTFLSEDKTVPPVSVALSHDGQLSLGAEYISLDRLGEHRCEVCGERATSREGLDEHRSNAGHYKCNRPECCGKVFPNAEELASHLRSTHPAQFARPMLVVNQALQSPPVQQLQQQVQRLAMPPLVPAPQQQQQGYLNQALTNNNGQLSPMQQQQQMRPPPMYRVPPPATMAPPPGAGIAPGYAAQHMMSQMYNQQQQYRQMQPGGGVFHPQQMQQQQQQQQRPNYLQQMQMQRPPQQMQQQQQQQRMMGPGMQRPQMQAPRKRMSPMGTLPGAPPAKRRDDDIHVIGVQQKRPGLPDKRPGLPDSMIHLTESITLSVRQPPSSAVTVTPIGTPPKNKDAKAVANVLASRGITVTPAAAGGGGGGGGAGRPQQRLAPAPPSPVATLNLNSAISIIPTGSGQAGGGGFAVPQNRSRQPQTQNVERPPRPPTVDLTGDGPMGIHHRGGSLHVRGRRGRPPGSMSSGRHVCQICDKAFTTEESLGQHMQLHRSPGKLPYRCNLCTAQYPTQQGLLQHRQVYHKEPASGPELAIPVVDLKQPGVLTRLANLGIVNYVPLSQLSSPQGGHFGLPVVSVDGARDPAVSNLSTMGASNILSLGPIKQLPR